MLSELSIGFEFTDLKEYKVLYNIDEERSHLLFVSPFISEFTQSEKYQLYSIIGVYPSAVPDTSMVQKFLELNSSMEIGNFQSYDHSEGKMLVYSVIYHGKLNPDLFHSLASTTVRIADYFEKEWFQSDEY